MQTTTANTQSIPEKDANLPNITEQIPSKSSPRSSVPNENSPYHSPNILSLSQNTKHDYSGLTKLIKGNDGKAYKSPKGTDNNSSKILSSSIRVPTPLKPSYSNLSLEQKDLHTKSQITENKADLDQQVHFRQETILNQEIPALNKQNIGLFLQSFLLSPQSAQPSIPSFEETGSNKGDLGLSINTSLMDILNLRALEFAYDHLNKEFGIIMENHVSLQRHCRQRAYNKTNAKSNIITEGSRNFRPENFREINSLEGLFAEVRNTAQTEREKLLLNSSTHSNLQKAKNSLGAANIQTESWQNFEDKEKSGKKEILADKESKNLAEYNKLVNEKQVIESQWAGKEEISQRRPSNRWQTIKEAQEQQIQTEVEEPYVINLHFNSKENYQTIKHASVGEEYQTILPIYNLNRDNEKRKNLKNVWNPENINEENLAKFMEEISLAINENVENEEKALKVLREFNMDTSNAMNHIKKNVLFYKNIFKLQQRSMRSQNTASKLQLFTL